MCPLETLVLRPVAESVALVSGRGPSVSVSMLGSPSKFWAGRKGWERDSRLSQPSCRHANGRASPLHFMEALQLLCCSLPMSHRGNKKIQQAFVVKGQFNSMTLYLVGEEERGLESVCTWRYSLLLSTLGVQPLSSLLSRLC